MKSVLAGEWDKEAPSLPVVNQEKFWKPLLETGSKPDVRNPEQVNDTIHSFGRPITAKEVDDAIRRMQDGATGPDKMDRSMLQTVSASDLTTHMMFWPLCECPPSSFREGTTTGIPKSNVLIKVDFQNDI